MKNSDETKYTHPDIGYDPLSSREGTDILLGACDERISRCIMEQMSMLEDSHDEQTFALARDILSGSWS